MRTILKLERFRGGKLIEVREQLSQSYVLDFMRLLYTQQAQASTYETPASTLLNMCFPAGPASWRVGYSPCLGIQVGQGTTPATPTDVQLEYPIGHGRTYKTLQPKLTNPSFETGDTAGWDVSAFSASLGWAATGLYSVIRTGVGIGYIQQSVDVTNVTGIKARFYVYWGFNESYTVTIWLDAVQLYSQAMGAATRYWAPLIAVSASGTKTLKFQIANVGSTPVGYIDSVELFGTQLEYGGSEVTFPTFSGGNGEMALRRFFYNRSGSSVTINEVGLIAYPGRLILRDVVSPGVALAHGETLRATYQMQITV